MNSSLIGSLAAEIALTTAHTISADHIAPPPANYLAIVGLWGVFGLLEDTSLGPVTRVLAWGLVIATLLHMWTPAQAAHVQGPSAPIKL